jgi:hypothetical protein
MAQRGPFLARWAMVLLAVPLLAALLVASVAWAVRSRCHCLQPQELTHDRK